MNARTNIEDLMARVCERELISDRDDADKWTSNRLAYAAWKENHRTRATGERDVYVECNRK